MVPHNSPLQVSLRAQFEGSTHNNADVEMAICKRCKFIRSYIISTRNIRHNIYIMLYMMIIAKSQTNIWLSLVTISSALMIIMSIWRRETSWVQGHFKGRHHSIVNGNQLRFFKLVNLWRVCSVTDIFSWLIRTNYTKVYGRYKTCCFSIVTLSSPRLSLWWQLAGITGMTVRLFSISGITHDLANIRFTIAIARTDPRLAVRPAEGPNSFHWKWRLIWQMQTTCSFFYGTNWREITSPEWSLTHWQHIRGYTR